MNLRAWDITLLAAHSTSHVIFSRFFHVLPPFRLLRFYDEKNILLLGEHFAFAVGWRPLPLPTAYDYDVALVP